MRDWNRNTWSIYLGSITRFVEYLWGIETHQRDWRGLQELHVCRIPMRDWNTIGRPDKPFRVKPRVKRFVEYLWGIETKYKLGIILLGDMFVEYLWGIETDFLHVFHVLPNWFVEYLWGIETPFDWFKKGMEFVEYLWGIETHLSLLNISPNLVSL